jgi:hypothetical protein
LRERERHPSRSPNYGLHPALWASGRPAPPPSIAARHLYEPGRYSLGSAWSLNLQSFAMQSVVDPPGNGRHDHRHHCRHTSSRRTYSTIYLFPLYWVGDAMLNRPCTTIRFHRDGISGGPSRVVQNDSHDQQTQGIECHRPGWHRLMEKRADHASKHSHGRLASTALESGTCGIWTLPSEPQ